MTSHAGHRAGDRKTQLDVFIAYVQKLCRSDPGCRAALRSGLGRRPEQAYRMHAFVGPWVPQNIRDRVAREATERAYYTVASLIAAQPARAREQPNEAEDRHAEPQKQEADAQDRSPEAPRDAVPVVLLNLGTSLGLAVAAGRERRGMGFDSAERRLHLLVRQGVHGVHRHLPPLVRHLRAGDVPIDWARLAEDLARWPTEHDYIAKSWLQSFYRTANPPQDDEQEQK